MERVSAAHVSMASSESPAAPIEAKEKRSRGNNFTEVELVELCKAYVYISSGQSNMGDFLDSTHYEI